MIKIEHIEGPSVSQWQAAIRGMRNPMNSWDKSDSEVISDSSYGSRMFIGESDLALMQKLAKAGTDHRKYLRSLPVTLDITAPLYWWKEYDTYKVGTVANSCSTMHKIASKKFTVDDFSHEHISDLDGEDYQVAMDELTYHVNVLNYFRDKYLETKEKKYWWQMIQKLSTSYNQKRTVFLNYEVVWNMYNARKDHKQDEWREFCEILKNELPWFRAIFFGEMENE